MSEEYASISFKKDEFYNVLVLVREALRNARAKWQTARTKDERDFFEERTAFYQAIVDKFEDKGAEA